jgi:hypothetical protein
MKKIILSAIMLIGLAFNGQSQKISNNAIGLRVGDNDGFGVEASYQRKVFDSNRLEFDFGVRNNTFRDNGYYYDSGAAKLVGLYQWVWKIDGGFNWYAGAGAGVGLYTNRNAAENNNQGDGAFGLVAGDIGVEYLFDFPLQLSIDFRPEIGFGDYMYTHDNLNTFAPDIAIGARWRF